MCYHASLKAKKSELETRYSKTIPESPPFTEKAYFSGFDRPALPVVTEQKMAFYHWGLIPHWINLEEKPIRKIFTSGLNARVETLFEKPFFKYAAQKQVALMPCTGFFEWQHLPNGQKQAYFIKHKTEKIFSIAALVDAIKLSPAETYTSFALITTEANPLMQRIHNTKMRMPLILPKELESRWLGSADTMERKSIVKEVLHENLWEAYPISPHFVEETKRDNTLPKPYQPPTQLSMF
ncbi:MAG: SOS response-associated peptidase [Luteibaculaceae bacterium]